MALGSIETPGDGPAFPELFVDHAGYVERVLRSLGVCEADLPDLRQEVFLVVNRRLDSFEGRSTLRTWLYGICLRVASGHRRRLRRRREHLAAAPPDRGDEPAQHDALLLQQTAELIESALARLPEGQRRAFVLYELEQRPMDEVARKLGCPLKTGFTRLYAARRRVNSALRRALGVAAVLEFAQPQGAHALAPASTAAARVDAIGSDADAGTSCIGTATSTPAAPIAEPVRASRARVRVACRRVAPGSSGRTSTHSSAVVWHESPAKTNRRWITAAFRTESGPCEYASGHRSGCWARRWSSDQLHAVYPKQANAAAGIANRPTRPVTNRQSVFCT